MKKISDVVENRTKFSPLVEFSREIPWKDEGDIISRVGNNVYIKHLDGPLFFGFASRFQDMINAMPEVKVVIIRMDKVPLIDQSGLYALEDVIFELQQRNVEVLLVLNKLI